MTALEPPRRFRHLPHAEIASMRVPIAVDLPSRLLGLALLRPGRAGAGLLIPRCRSVHTFGMRFPIDVVFLDQAMRTISVRESVPARRILHQRGAEAALEIPAPRTGSEA